LVDLIIKIALGNVAVGVVLATFQLLRGPDAPNRAIALDVLTLITVPMLVAVAIITGRAIYLDVALVYAILAFLGVITLARYYDRGL